MKKLWRCGLAGGLLAGGLMAATAGLGSRCVVAVLLAVRDRGRAGDPLYDRCHGREYSLPEHDLCGIPPAQQGCDRRLSEGDDLAFPRRVGFRPLEHRAGQLSRPRSRRAVNLGVFCQQAETLMKQAKALDPAAFRAYAASQAATAGAQYAKCGAARSRRADGGPSRPRS